MRPCARAITALYFYVMPYCCISYSCIIQLYPVHHTTFQPHSAKLTKDSPKRHILGRLQLHIFGVHN